MMTHQIDPSGTGRLSPALGEQPAVIEVTEETRAKIEAFWKKHIANRKVLHASHSIFEGHLRRHGFGKVKPFPALYARISAFYEKHKKHVAAQLLLEWSLLRYKDSRPWVHFSFSQGILDRFLYKDKKGSELIYGLDRFLTSLEKAQIELSPEDKREKIFCEELISWVRERPSLLVSVKCSDPAFDKGMSSLVLGSFPTFLRKVALKFPDDLQAGRVEAVCNRIMKEWSESSYEVVSAVTLPPASLTLAIVSSGSKRKLEEQSSLGLRQSAREELRKIINPAACL